MSVWIYAKAVSGAAMAAVMAVITALNDGVIDGGEWITIAITFFVALGAVYAVTGSDVTKVIKAVIAAIVAGLGALATAWAEHMSFNLSGIDWLNVALAVLVSFGVVQAVPPHNALATPPTPQTQAGRRTA